VQLLSDRAISPTNPSQLEELPYLVYTYMYTGSTLSIINTCIKQENKKGGRIQADYMADGNESSGLPYQLAINV